MSLIIATGSNIGDSIQHLKNAQKILEENFTIIKASRIYRSAAVDYLDQPDFFNQVLEFKIPDHTPSEVLEKLLSIEKIFGRVRDISRGPRTLDLDIIFWNLEEISLKHLIIPHPRWRERSFIIRPLSELPFFQRVEKCFTMPESFQVEAYPI
jgi:2-amino-4-hydroxy-6-hydroxymethyldihydropteridine diphosphokinase